MVAWIRRKGDVRISATGGRYEYHLGSNLQQLQNGKYMYIIDSENQIRYAPIPPEDVVPQRYITHSQLTGGQRIRSSTSKKVLGAGEFEVVDGQIVMIDTGSGHFKPTPDAIIYTEAVFRSKGLVHDGTQFTTFPPEHMRLRILRGVQRQIKRTMKKLDLWPEKWWPHID